MNNEPWRSQMGLETELANKESALSYMTRRTSIIKTGAFICGTSIILGIWGYILLPGILDGASGDYGSFVFAVGRYLTASALAVAIAVTVAVVVAFLIIYGYHAFRLATLESEIELLHSKRKIAANLLPQPFTPTDLAPFAPTDLGDDRPPETRPNNERLQDQPHSEEFTYFDRLVNINLQNLDAYLTLAKIHTDRSFIVSLVAGVVGLLFIMIGLLVGIFVNPSENSVPYMSTAAGIITEFIAAIFFYLYNKTVRQLKQYHDSLLSVQNILLSLRMIRDVINDTQRGDVIVQLVSYLVGQDSGVAAAKPARSIRPTTKQPTQKPALVLSHDTVKPLTTVEESTSQSVDK